MTPIHFRGICVLFLSAALTGCAAHSARPAASVSPPADLPLTVMTYNIHHGAGSDNKIDLDRLARVIRSCEPDLVAIQEIERSVRRSGGIDEPAELARLTGMTPVFAKTMDWDGGEFGDAVLTRFPLVSSQVIQLPFTPGNHREPRIALRVICKTPAGEIAFLSTHLDHTGHSPDRLPQAMAIVEAMAGENRPAILAGDLNCGPESEPVKAIEKTWTRAGNGDSAMSYPADNPQESIDHIFVKPADRWKILSTRVIDERIASDHRPVVVKLDLMIQD